MTRPRQVVKKVMNFIVIIELVWTNGWKVLFGEFRNWKYPNFEERTGW